MRDRDLCLFLGTRARLSAVDHHRRGRYLSILCRAAVPIALGRVDNQSPAELDADAAFDVLVRPQQSIRAPTRLNRRGNLHRDGLRLVSPLPTSPCLAPVGLSDFQPSD